MRTFIFDYLIQRTGKKRYEMTEKEILEVRKRASNLESKIMPILEADVKDNRNENGRD